MLHVSDAGLLQILVMVFAIVANMPLDFTQAGLVGLYVLMLECVCRVQQRLFPAIQVYEAVEFSNDLEPMVTTALKEKHVKAVRVLWGPEPTDFMCLACTTTSLSLLSCSH